MFNQRVRTQVRSAYQMQDLRIQTGNRIAANFRRKLGIPEGEEADEDQKDILYRLKKSYDRITEGIARITARRKYEYDGVISNYAELRLVDHFLHLVDEEKRIFRDVERSLEGIDVWDDFLTDVKGVGPAMGGCIISELDPHKAPYPSSFFRYCGVDVVSEWELDGYEWEKGYTGNGQPPEVELKTTREWVWKNNPEKQDENVFDHVDFHEHNGSVTAHCTRTVTDKNDNPWTLHVTYEQVTKGGRSRRDEHLVEREYEDADGNIKTRRSLGFNPFIKTKLMGVLAPSFLRAQGFYSELYYDYKHRLKHEDEHADKTDGHIHMMAQRWMIKQFLIDLHVKWRDLEDLPVTKPYHVAVLGKSNHGREERLGVTDPKRYGDE